MVKRYYVPPPAAFHIVKKFNEKFEDTKCIGSLTLAASCLSSVYFDFRLVWKRYCKYKR